MKVIVRIIFLVKQQGALLGIISINTHINRIKYQDVSRQTRFKVEKVNTVFTERSCGTYTDLFHANSNILRSEP